jgi:hypothetical protein
MALGLELNRMDIDYVESKPSRFLDIFFILSCLTIMVEILDFNKTLRRLINLEIANMLFPVRVLFSQSSFFF